jgi:hypothetical protein
VKRLILAVVALLLLASVADARPFGRLFRGIGRGAKAAVHAPAKLLPPAKAHAPAKGTCTKGSCG